ncbi:hypothetical protein VNI00_001554 [Paramarasmius palmivorus]|uniref:Hyaluronan/mRNA-binding protein domain-containing protein n=1 Tax=Paramarasmius palmivorus TaxID=297713 RepID=A0AAW0E1I5_9AGAR
MSVASKNPFALLDDAGDDGDIKSSSAPAPKKAAAATPAPPAASKDNQKARTGPASRGGKYYQRGGGANRSRDISGNPNQNGVEEPEAIPKKFEGQGRGRGRGRGGGQRGGRRPFDRHSQTGKTDSDKKIHQGWGGDDGNTELQAEAAASKDAATEGATTGEWGTDGATNADAWAAPADGDAAAGGDKPAGEEGSRPPRKEEEEDNTLTLEQYLAQQKEKDAIVPKLEPRKVERADFGDAVALQKGGDEDAYFVGKTKNAPKARAKKEEKVFLEIDARFDRPGRGGRGGRGTGRGGRGSGGGGRGGNRTNNPRGDNTPNVDDEAAFPSLA